MYQYWAHVVNVVDGDTIDLDIDLGFHVGLNRVRCRLYGIDTPEVRGEEREAGLKVAQVVRDWFTANDNWCVIRSHVATFRPDKYGRWLVECYVSETATESLNSKLLADGAAQPMVY